MRKVCHSQTFVINTECFLSISQVNTVEVFHGCFTYNNVSHGYLSTYIVPIFFLLLLTSYRSHYGQKWGSAFWGIPINIQLTLRLKVGFRFFVLFLTTYRSHYGQKWVQLFRLFLTTYRRHYGQKWGLAFWVISNNIQVTLRLEVGFSFLGYF